MAESSVGRASALGRDSPAGDALGGAGFELVPGPVPGEGRESAGPRSEGSADPFGITGDTSGLVSFGSPSPAHSESISAVSGAIDEVRDVRAAASDNNEGRDGTGPVDEGALAGCDDVDAGSGDGAPDASPGVLGLGLVAADCGASLFVPPFFRPRDPCRLMLPRNHMARFAEKCESAERPHRFGSDPPGSTASEALTDEGKLRLKWHEF